MPAQPDLPAELPAELREVETLLREFVPVESAINRDASLYEAGWAAALAQAPQKSHWLWPATSAVLAASLLFLIAYSPASSLQRAGTEPKNTPQQKALPPLQAQTPPPRTFTLPPRRYTLAAPMLTMRDRALRMEFDEPVSFAGRDDNYAPAPKSLTARELLQELLGETS
ncbi:MAG: hypothetical protein GXP24_04625 [Planctomycetes bacterium]|nr:hypothetical protein [Planctomycetota bacterium]